MHSPNQTIFMKIAFLTTLLFLGSVSVAQADNGVPLAPVRVVDAEMQQLAPVSWVAGTVVGRHDSRISAEVEGQLESVADIGDKLSEGDVIARIDDLTLRLQVAESEAAVARITARLRFNEREVKRLAQLAKENNAAKNRLDEVQSNRDWDRAELKAAEARLAQAKAALTAATGHLVGFVQSGRETLSVVLSLIIFTVPGVIVGGQLGASVAASIPQPVLERALGVLFLFIAALTLGEAIL